MLFAHRNKAIPVVPLILLTFAFLTVPSYGSLESSLIAIKTKLTVVIFPLVAVMGVLIAALSLYTGNPNAKQHVVYAIFASMIGFGAQGIIDLISQTVRSGV